MLHQDIDWEKAFSEVVRGLRRGGRLLGFDLLANRPMRRLHQAECSHHRMMRWDELRRETHTLPLLGVLNRSPGGLTARFDLQKR